MNTVQFRRDKGRGSQVRAGLLALAMLCGCREKPSTPPPAAKPAQPAQPVQAQAAPVKKAGPFVRSDIPRIDVHTHVMLGASLRAVRLFDGYGIVHAVNLSGPPPEFGLDDFVTDGEAAYKRMTVFVNIDWQLCDEPNYGPRMAADLVKAKSLGARGVKITKALGLAVKCGGKLLAVDDPGLDPLFEKAGELGLPVAIHIGDPQAFWEAPTDANERIEELSVHPEWSFYAAQKRGDLPSWQALFDAFVRRVGRHPKTTFIGVHFGNAPEDPDLVSRTMDAHPNLMIDTAARLPAIGRHDAKHSAEKLRAFFLKFQDRILFGTDTGVGRNPTELMFGSSGAEAPTSLEADRFFNASWRYFETADSDIPSPTPIQGRWNIEGIDLPRPVLEKIYYKNAQKLLHIELPTEPLPKQSLTPISPGKLEDF